MVNYSLNFSTSAVLSIDCQKIKPGENSYNFKYYENVGIDA
jgi:hypothetical protein